MVRAEAGLRAELDRALPALEEHDAAVSTFGEQVEAGEQVVGLGLDGLGDGGLRPPA
ncbi:hypothetical protein GCM10023085_47100 [Actinomadura viridis]|uniref:Uncharacterized protein n=1 Tax=Actinomadura viridis TaxID=58110 RepID=A0A931GPN0_9ACTN|nr:hypothetical protein [Actinomadura viridis]MBG6090786.1 hypothetical protein [Actinomadura viridis]